MHALRDSASQLLSLLDLPSHFYFLLISQFYTAPFFPSSFFTLLSFASSTFFSSSSCLSLGGWDYSFMLGFPNTSHLEQLLLFPPTRSGGAAPKTHQVYGFYLNILFYQTNKRLSVIRIVADLMCTSNAFFLCISERRG